MSRNPGSDHGSVTAAHLPFVNLLGARARRFRRAVNDMADYYLVGNLEDDDDLWLINKTEGTANPVPKAIWEDVIAMFQAEVSSREPEAHETRKDMAASILATIDSRGTVNRGVSLAIAANELGSVLATLRIEPVDRFAQTDAVLARFLSGYVVHHSG
jgi:hypothetical protein